MGRVLGRLCLSQILWKKITKVYSFRVWELKDDKRHWHLIHKVSFPPWKALVVGLQHNDGDKLLVTTDANDVCLYDNKSKLLKSLADSFRVILTL